MNRSEAGKLGAAKTKALWRERYESSPKRCAFCNEVLPYEKRKNKFCNQSCAAKQNNVLFPKRPPKPANICKFCGEVIVDKKCKRRKFCNATCNGNYIWRKSKNKIENGEILDKKTFKKYLMEINGVRCEVCGLTEWCGQEVPLVMDHIDGNSDNWSLNNLRLVCGNCDMQLPTYKGKNIGSGRYYRRIRYREGKSY